jgi:hypothetical protein
MIKVASTSTTDWIDTLAYDKHRFERSLRELGLRNEVIDRDLRRYDRLQGPPPRVPENMHFYGPDGAQEYLSQKYADRLRHLKQGLVRFVSGREYRVVDESTARTRLPLLRFHSPPVPGSKVTVKLGSSYMLKGGWTVTVGGVGLGPTTTLDVSTTSTYSSSSGACKLLSIPVNLLVQRVDVFERGRLIGSGTRAHVQSNVKNPTQRTVRSDPPESCEAGPATGDGDPEWDFRQDRTSDVHVEVHGWEVSNALNMSVPLTAFGFGLSVEASIHLSSSLEVVCELPAGHRYIRRRAADAHGFVWRVD